MKPFHIGPRWQIFIAILVVIFWVMAHQHFSQMHGRFFQASFQGMQALLSYEIGNFKEAAASYRAHFIESDNWEETDDPGLNALLQADLFLAETISRADLKKEINKINAYLTLGEIALSKGREDEALSWINRVLENEVDQFDALLLASILHTRAGKGGEAIHLINRALRYPRADTRITTFFWVLDAMGGLLDLPDDTQHNTLLAHYFRYLRIFDTRNGKRALSYAQRGLKNNDHIESAYLTTGIIFHKINKIDKALYAYNKALGIDRQYSEAYRRMALVYSERGQLAKEYEMTKLAYEAAPKDVFYIRDYQDFLSDKLGDYYQALMLTEQLLKKDPQNINLIKSAAFYLRFIGKEEEAIKYYKKGLDFYPKKPALYEGLGYAFNELERFDEALAAFQAALSIKKYTRKRIRGYGFCVHKNKPEVRGY